MNETSHSPVLVEEAVQWLEPKSGGIYVDCNLGAGGHARRILEASVPDGLVVGFDWDEAALCLARDNLAAFSDRVIFVHGNFAEMEEVLKELHITGVDGILLDLGLSSMQLSRGGRGFSFQHDEPLDMRMDVRRPITAAEIVNKASQEELADILYHFGEERQARRIATAIVESRKREPITTSGQLARIVTTAVPKRFHPPHIHMATRVFQALRIAVNDELANLEKVLQNSATLLRESGKICVISFHSLEDRIVKRSFQSSRLFKIKTKKPVTPSKEECRDNPRARSAKMRVASVAESRYDG